MKTYVTFLCMTLLMCCCTKEYSVSTTKPVVTITVTGEPYYGVVNGSNGYYWKITAGIDSILKKDITITYKFDDVNGIKDADLNHVINAGVSKSNWITQYLASSSTAKINNIRLISVKGADEYTFKMKN